MTRSEKFNLANSFAVAIIGLLVSLIGSGIIGMVVLYSDVAKLTADEIRLDHDLSRHLDHSVDKEAYEIRDRAIQKQIDARATKDEVQQLREEFKQELIDLKEFVRTTQDAYSASLRRH